MMADSALQKILWAIRVRFQTAGDKRQQANAAILQDHRCAAVRGAGFRSAKTATILARTPWPQSFLNPLLKNLK
jgi:hypothetical protein